MAKQQQQYRTYEDLMDEPRHESGGKIDFDVGEMFKLPAGIEWWMAKREWGKFKGEPKNMKPGDNERQVDVRR